MLLSMDWVAQIILDRDSCSNIFNGRRGVFLNENQYLQNVEDKVQWLFAFDWFKSNETKQYSVSAFAHAA